MALNEQDVVRIAQLARIALPADQRPHAHHALNNMLHIIEQLAAVDMTDVEPLAHPLFMHNAVALPMREDCVTDPPSDAARQALMQNAPQTWDGFFLVPKVVE
jgi:aspartyl-tRNA(Asn)/glutamyl-tRNA(Gln) amidotransferase subunit C